jgi:hypothetical protein
MLNSPRGDIWIELYTHHCNFHIVHGCVEIHGGLPPRQHSICFPMYQGTLLFSLCSYSLSSNVRVVTCAMVLPLVLKSSIIIFKWWPWLGTGNRHYHIKSIELSGSQFDIAATAAAQAFQCAP